jgi:steroid 5-alpha reductase family enzyme
MKKDYSKKSSIAFVMFAYITAFAAAWITVLIVPGEWSPFLKGFAADLSATGVVFIFSLITGNSSIYDPFWSVVPPVLFGYWIIQTPTEGGGRIIWLFFTVVCLWAVRLTLNWAVNWKGLSQEDWRYIGFRNKFKKFYWLVSFFGIHLFPTIIVFIVSIPAYALIIGLHNTVSGWAVAAIAAGTIIMLVGIALELISDIQMIKFKQKNENKMKINTRGLWKYSRHPNYLGEVTFWFGVGVFSLSASLENYQLLVCPIAMLFLFVFYSIPAMEKKIKTSRPLYSEVQKTISSLLILPKGMVFKESRPLSQRRGDIVYVVIFSLFLCTSLITDSLNGITAQLNPDSQNAVEQVIYSTYAVKADPALIWNQPTVRVSAGISAFLWGPMYLFFIISFVRGWNAIRNWGFLYSAALTSSMILYMSEGLFGAHPTPNPMIYLITNAAYFLVPLSMIIRMWKKEPFGPQSFSAK